MQVTAAALDLARDKMNKNRQKKNQKATLNLRKTNKTFNN